MSEYKLKWLNQPQNIEVPEGAISANSIFSVESQESGTNGTSSLVRKSALESETEVLNEIGRRISVGAPVHIWSKTVERWVYWVKDEDIKLVVENENPEAIVFTLAEIKILIEEGCDAVGLSAVCEAKSILRGSVIMEKKS
jgi:hypothetical protein